MAKITFSPLLGPYGQVSSFYDAPLQLQGQKSSSTQVIYKDTGEGNDKIVLDGTGFSWSGDILGTGVVNGVSFTTKQGDPYLTIKGIEYTVSEFNSAYMANGVQGVEDLLLSKADVIKGSRISDDIHSGGGGDTVRAGKGADSIDGGLGADRLYGEAGKDYIFGGAGNDRMWGGAASDHFHYSSGNGKDRIMDFDAKGGGSKQDYLSLYESDEFTARKDGKNTVLDFGDGDTLTLVGVKRSDFSVADIDWL